MPLPDVINVHADFQYATAKLLQSSVNGKGNYEILLAAKPQEGVVAPMPPLDSVYATAQGLNCPLVLMSSMTRLGDRIILNFELHNSSDRSLVWQDHLKASTPEDLDPITERVANALGTDKKAVQDGDIYSVTNFEEKNLAQKRSNNSFGVSVGGMMYPGSPYNNEPFAGGVGALWAYDNRTMIVDMEIRLYEANKRTETNLMGINVWKPLTNADIAPYVGGGLALGDVTYKDALGEKWNEDGLLVSAGGGLLINRTSSVSLRLEARYLISTFEVHGSLPHGLQLNLVACFGGK